MSTVAAVMHTKVCACKFYHNRIQPRNHPFTALSEERCATQTNETQIPLNRIMADHPKKIDMQNPHEMPAYLVKMVQKYELMSSHELEEGEGRKLCEMIHVVASTAAFFGRYDGMKELLDAAEKMVGNDNSIGYRLNLMWDRIGGWWA